MKGITAIALLCTFFICSPTYVQSEKVLMCYYGSWAVYRSGNSALTIDKLPINLCTHIIYTFVGANPDGTVRVMDAYSDLSENYGKDGFRKFTSLKKLNPNVKFMIALGGYNEGSEKYSSLFKTDEMRSKFAKNVVTFLQTYDFDGFDLDWEYPAQRGGAKADKTNFIELIKALKNEFLPYGYLLTAAVGATEQNHIKPSYDVANMGKYLDYINLMTYDFHGSWESFTGHNAPTFVSVAELNTAEQGFNLESCVNAWINYGSPANKLVLGIPFYGHSYTLGSSTQSCLAARCPVSGAGSGGPYLNEQGFLGYNEVCLQEKAAGVKLYWDTEAQVPYFVKGNQWVSYDNETSVEKKLTLVEKYGLAGGMVWSVDTDDFRGDCGYGKYPLLTVMNNVLKTSSNVIMDSSSPTTQAAISNAPVTTTNAPVTTNKVPVTTNKVPVTTTLLPDSSDTVICNNKGFIRDSSQCNVFYQCYKSGKSYTSARFVCPDNLVFDETTKSCNYPEKVTC